MPDIIFARSRTEYDSYSDFWRLVELSGFPLVYVDEIDPTSDHCYIYTPDNGETLNGWPDATARIIHYQLEWETHPNDQTPRRPGVSEKWTMDAWHARRIGARYVPIGSHPGLKGFWMDNLAEWFGMDTWISDSAYSHLQQYDLAVMAYMSFRRSWLIEEIKRSGLTIAPNGWGEDRHKILMGSRAMLHIHQHDAVPGVAALRLAVAAAYSLPVITESCEDYGIFGHSHLLRCDYGNLATFCQMWVHRNESRILEDYGRALHQLLCVQKPFRKCIEEAV